MLHTGSWAATLTFWVQSCQLLSGSTASACCHSVTGKIGNKPVHAAGLQVPMQLLHWPTSIKFLGQQGSTWSWVLDTEASPSQIIAANHYSGWILARGDLIFIKNLNKKTCHHDGLPIQSSLMQDCIDRPLCHWLVNGAGLYCQKCRIVLVVNDAGSTNTILHHWRHWLVTVCSSSCRASAGPGN
jgi:hypothetical protein